MAPGIHLRPVAALVLVAGAGCAPVTRYVTYGSASAPAPAAVANAVANVDAPPGVDVHFYDVVGSTAAALRQDLDQKAPLDAFGKRHDAHAHWDVAWHFPYRQTPGSCAIASVRVTTTVRYDLPRWTGEEDAAPALRARWEAYLRALLVHEAGHRQHGLDAARDIARALPLLPPQATCPQMEALANARARAILDRYRAADVRYDETTRNGATQGAVFRGTG